MSLHATSPMNYLLIHLSAAFIVVTIIIAGSCPGWAGELEFRPSLVVSEEVNDNILETVRDRRTEFITRAQPGFTSRYQAPLWNWDAAYNFSFVNYARATRGNEYNHDANLRSTVTLVRDFMLVDLSEAYHRVMIDVSRSVATESSAFLNQTDQNIAVISPYFLWRLSGNDVLRTGYRYREVRYKGNGVETFEHAGTANFTHEVSSRFSLSADYEFNFLESHPTRYTKHDVSGGFRYEYADRSFVFGRAGNSWQHFHNGVNTRYIFWNAGVTHDFNVALATIETRVQTAADPLSASTKETIYSGRIEKAMDRGTAGFTTSYTEYVNTEVNSANHKRFTLGLTARYEVFNGVTAESVVTGDRSYFTTGTDFRYHLNAMAGVSYAFNRDLTVGARYSYDIRCNDTGSCNGGIEVNRGTIEIRKLF